MWQFNHLKDTTHMTPERFPVTNSPETMTKPGMARLDINNNLGEVPLTEDDVNWFYNNYAENPGSDFNPDGPGILKYDNGSIDLIDNSGKVCENIMKNEPDFNFGRFILQRGQLSPLDSLYPLDKPDKAVPESHKSKGYSSPNMIKTFGGITVGLILLGAGYTIGADNAQQQLEKGAISDLNQTNNELKDENQMVLNNLTILNTDFDNLKKDTYILRKKFNKTQSELDKTRTELNFWLNHKDGCIVKNPTYDEVMYFLKDDPTSENKGYRWLFLLYQVKRQIQFTIFACSTCIQYLGHGHNHN